MLADLVERFERGTANMAVREETALPLSALVTEFREAVARRSGERHTLDVTGHVTKVLTGCKLTTLGDLRAPGVAPRVEAFVWSLMEGESAVSATTAAYTGKHARQFTRWLWRKRKLLDSDPLAGVDLPSQQTGNPRRALTAEELERVITAAEGSEKTVRDLTGQDRATIYLTAAATGYRAGELARLTPADFDLSADIPVARLSGKLTKNKQAAVQPLPPWLAQRLATYLAGRARSQPVWPGQWYRRAADIFRIDLAAANVPVSDGQGEALFHSLRHTYTSLLTRSASVKVTQDLLRHSSPALTIGRYSHTSMEEKAEAVAALPLPGATVATGPFSGMPRAELEATAETLLVAVRFLGELAGVLVTHRVTQEVETSGDGVRRVETSKGRKRRVG